MSARGGGCLLPAGSARPHPVDRMTDAFENIYFPHLLLRTVKIEGHCLTLNESISISPFDVDGRRLMEGALLSVTSPVSPDVL